MGAAGAVDWKGRVEHKDLSDADRLGGLGRVRAEVGLFPSAVVSGPFRGRGFSLDSRDFVRSAVEPLVIEPVRLILTYKYVYIYIYICRSLLMRMWYMSLDVRALQGENKLNGRVSNLT